MPNDPRDDKKFTAPVENLKNLLGIGNAQPGSAPQLTHTASQDHSVSHYGFAVPPGSSAEPSQSQVEEPDVTDPYSEPTVKELVKTLLDPPHHAYSKPGVVPNTVKIDMHWVMGRVTEKHFVRNKELGRSVLKDNSKIRTHGQVTSFWIK
ncbi:uncharacterized protein BDR25DRAFT_383571 [Lindgomyces ingoldianus]|uniref:Uncharacterized protein n=1 Tax=Lindgomyces ingoldianus TaxID=673940 RepID=A0ACB6Q9C6_9PLEO|nr:uncharacterized protein BDR25DRAFT_383571 [Lindgomyces ingoldianus]KAF2463516.1 hypothetical protein BDR25DRAFT_383571 [Lindgomyces ingoldianus]